VSELEFERRVEQALRAPVVGSAHAREAIMARVRRAASENTGHRFFSTTFVRTARHSIVGAALAAGIGSITTFSTLVPVKVARNGGEIARSAVIGDSVVDRLRDTLRLVRLMFDDSAAHQVAVVGDFNGWHPHATPMRRRSPDGRWEARLALRDGLHRYAIVVDNTRWVGDAGSRSGGAAGHVYSLLHVARASN